MKNLKLSLRECFATAAISSLFILAACGDENSRSKGTEPAEVSDIMATTFDDLPVCTAKCEGAVAYVKDEKTAYTCIDGVWTPESEVPSSSSVAVDASSSSRHCEDCKDEATSSGKDELKFSSSGKDESSSFSIKGNSSSSVSQSSSSVALSSSFVILSDSEESSSSTDSLSSSSSDSMESSSSIGEVVSSSSSVELDCSALLESETGWNWDVPKECRFNPAITYGAMTDPRDNKVYKTIKIGDQVWMAENLNYADSATTPSLLERSWCYKNDSANCAVAGRLYTWAAAIDSVKLATDADNPQDCGYDKTCTLPTTVRGICPDGWHLPTQTEWQTLFTAVGGQSNAGKVLKSQTGWYNGANGTDAYGFSALPAGRRFNGGGFYSDDFYSDGDVAYFMSATERDRDYAYYMYLSHDVGFAGLDYATKYNGKSIRCLQD